MIASLKNSNRQLILNMGANIVAFSSNMLVAFVLTPFLIDKLGKETYSFYPIANTFVAYIGIVVNALNAMASRFITVSLVQKREEDTQRYFTSLFFADLAINGLLLVPLILVIIYLKYILHIPVNATAAIQMLFALIFASTMLNVFAAVFGIATFACNRLDLRSARELICALVKLGGFYLFYRYLPPSIVYVGIVMMIVAVVNIGLQIWLTRYLLPDLKIKFQYLSFSHIRELFTSSIWNTINTLGNILLAGTTLILSNILYGASVSGTYAIVQTVPVFICGVITMLASVFFPVITYRYAQNDKPALIREIHKSQTLIGIGGGTAIIVFIGMCENFFQLWTPQEDARQLQMLSILTILPHFAITCLWSLSNLNVAMNRVRWPAIVTLSAGAANILLALGICFYFKPGIWFLPTLSSVLQLGWIVVFLPLYCAANLKENWHIFYPPLLRAICCLPVVLLITLVCRHYAEPHLSWIRFLFAGGVAGLLGLGVFALGMLGFRTCRELISTGLAKIGVHVTIT